MEGGGGVALNLSNSHADTVRHFAYLLTVRNVRDNSNPRSGETGHLSQPPVFTLVCVLHCQSTVRAGGHVTIRKDATLIRSPQSPLPLLF